MTRNIAALEVLPCAVPLSPNPPHIASHRGASRRDGNALPGTRAV